MLSCEDLGWTAVEAVQEWQSWKWQYFNLWQIAVWPYIERYIFNTDETWNLYGQGGKWEAFSTFLNLFIPWLLPVIEVHSMFYSLVRWLLLISSMRLLAQTFLSVAKSIGREKTFSTCTRAVICKNCCLFHHDKFIYTDPVTCLIMKFHRMFSIRVVLCFLSPLCINGAVICSVANTTRYYYFKHHVKVSWNLYSSVL